MWLFIRIFYDIYENDNIVNENNYINEDENLNSAQNKQNSTLYFFKALKCQY